MPHPANARARMQQLADETAVTGAGGSTADANSNNDDEITYEEDSKVYNFD
jgi:hypothetical protein